MLTLFNELNSLSCADIKQRLGLDPEHFVCIMKPLCNPKTLLLLKDKPKRAVFDENE